MSEDIQKKYIEQMGAPLGKLFYELSNEVVSLHVRWKEYLELYGTKPSRIDLMNRAAPGFFRLVQNVFIEAIILQLARLTDPPESCHKANCTIRQLPRHIEDEKVALEIQDFIETAAESIKICRDWRNRYIAHRDLSLALKEGSRPLEPIEREKLEAAMSAIAQVMNKVQFYMIGSTMLYHMGVSSSASAVELLKFIDEGLKFKDERLKRLRSGEYNPEDFKSREV